MRILFSFSSGLEGRSCLCIALSHHLFLDRPLIPPLIISCSALSVEVGCIHLVLGLFLTFFHPSSSFLPFLPFLPSLLGYSRRAKLHVYNWCNRAPSLKHPFWAVEQTTNSPLPYSSWVPFTVTHSLSGMKREPWTISAISSDAATISWSLL